MAASELYSLYHSPRPYLTLEDGLQALDILRSRGITVGAISNFDNRLHDIVPSLGLNKYLQFVVTSEDAKSSKPEELIFEFALNKSGLKNLKPDEILHIGEESESMLYLCNWLGNAHLSLISSMLYLWLDLVCPQNEKV